MKPISYNAFRILSFQQQTTWVWDEGRHIATRYEEKDTVRLYYMRGHFFVELVYGPIANTLQPELRTLMSGNRLEAYGGGIDSRDIE